MRSEKFTRRRRRIVPPLLHFFRSVPLHQYDILFISEDRVKAKEIQYKIKEGVACFNFHASAGGGADI